MTTPKCPQCNCTTFAMTGEMIGANTVPTILVHCNDCGSVVGSMDSAVVGPTINKFKGELDMAIRGIQAKLNMIETRISMLPKS
jgi:hypothetical protein